MIYIVSGGPGEGKTFYAARWALRELERGNKSRKKKKVFTNFPLIHRSRKKVISSYIWRPEYIYQNIYDSFVFIDESYVDYNSKCSKDFDEDMQVFFSQQRHNGNDLIMISPNPARINIIIREMANLIIQVHAHLNLWRHPLYFTTEQFISIEDYNSRSTTHDTVYAKGFYFYKKKVGKAYDTHQFRNTGDEFDPTTWYNEEDDTIRE